MGSFRGGTGGESRCVCAGACVLGESMPPRFDRNGFRGFRELFVLPHSRAPAGTRTVGLVRHGTCLRRVRDAVLVNQ